MSKTKNKPGIHLYKNTESEKRPYYYWHTLAKNVRITCNGETYTTKGGALDGISSAAKTLGGTGRFKYYDHSKPDSPLQSYL